MKPYTASTNAGRIKAGADIHHKTADGGQSNRAIVNRDWLPRFDALAAARFEEGRK